jgi:hypothetical protein
MVSEAAIAVTAALAIARRYWPLSIGIGPFLEI